MRRSGRLYKAQALLTTTVSAVRLNEVSQSVLVYTCIELLLVVYVRMLITGSSQVTGVFLIKGTRSLKQTAVTKAALPSVSPVVPANIAKLTM